MTYNKPEIAVLGNAARLFEITLIPKQCGPPEFPAPESGFTNPDPAYEADE